MSLGVYLHIDSGVILIGDVIQANQCLALAKIKGCQVPHFPTIQYLIGLWENEVLEFHEFYIAPCVKEG